MKLQMLKNYPIKENPYLWKIFSCAVFYITAPLIFLLLNLFIDIPPRFLLLFLWTGGSLAFVGFLSSLEAIIFIKRKIKRKE